MIFLADLSMFVIFYIYHQSKISGQFFSASDFAPYWSYENNIDKQWYRMNKKVGSQPTQKSFHKARFLYKYIDTQEFIIDE